MTIDTIGPIDPIRKPNDLQKISKPAEDPKKSDAVSLSQEALTQEKISAVYEEVMQTPDIRTDKVEAARAKLAQENWMDDKVLDSIADRLMGMFGF